MSTGGGEFKGGSGFGGGGRVKGEVVQGGRLKGVVDSGGGEEGKRER